MRKIFEKVIYKTDDFTIEHGKLKDDFISYLNDNNHSTFCFITPQNPCNKIINTDINIERLESLSNDLIDYNFVSCLSQHAFIDYPPEEGFIIFDITKEDATNLQKKYEQVAIIFGDNIECDLIF